jgi:alkanesulfonate monooxygenase SsuD/methylene tetrahydromethanopterin reductase-like flavin-dependent oxidoreductase (luciferase family)
VSAVTLGLRLPVSGPFAGAEATIEVAEHAEEAGFDTVWVHDHISWSRDKLTHFATGSIEACRDQDPNFLESITSIAFLAGRLRRVRVGIAGLVLPLRDARVLAKQLTTLERYSGSRVVTVVAVGNIPEDFAVMGVRWDRRGRITNDTLAALRSIMRGPQPVTFESKTVSFEKGSFYPQPERLPMWVAATSDAGLERAVRDADGWLTAYRSVEEFTALRENLRGIASAHGRDMATFTCAYETYACVADTRDAAVAIARRSLEQPPFKTLERGLDVAIVGSPADVIERISRYRDAGAGHVELKLLAHDLKSLHDQISLLARTVLPTFQASPAGAR